MDGEEKPHSALQYGHVSLLHTPALQADLQEKRPTSQPPPGLGGQSLGTRQASPQLQAKSEGPDGRHSNMPIASQHPPCGYLPLTLSLRPLSIT